MIIRDSEDYILKAELLAGLVVCVKFEDLQGFIIIIIVEIRVSRMIEVNES